jgi:ATP diphosphatase
MTHPTPEQALTRFLEIIAKLRDPQGGCPWDIKQTFQSLKPLIIEEAYEVADAVDSGEAAVKEELGDLLSLIALFSQIATEQDTFSFGSVVDGISDKLVRRHPHVFGDTKVSGTEEVLKNWEQIKQEERAQSAAPEKGLLDGLPRSLPALQKSHQIGERCARIGFDWGTKDAVADKVREELGEFLHELSPTTPGPGPSEGAIDPDRVFEEFGDLLFTLAQYSRHLGFSAEEALVAANNKFMKRFKQLEGFAKADHGSKSLGDLGQEVLERLWQRVKTAETAK